MIAHKYSKEHDNTLSFHTTTPLAASDREFSIETPVGSISSDSGNHFIDIISVIGVIGILYIGKIIIKEVIKRL